MFTPSIQRLIDIFSRFPTVGPRTAARFIFYLTKLSNDDFNKLIEALKNLKSSIKICSLCFNPFEGNKDVCQICQDPARDRTTLCVVASEADFAAIEKTKKYTGLYFILGGTLSSLKKESSVKIRIGDLEQRIKNTPEIQEVILAINPTTEGEATTLYLERTIKALDIKTTRLGRGLPVGGELEYADEDTLSSSLENRK